MNTINLEGQNLNNPKKMELLIYIPCHTDFEMAIRNAERIRRQFNQISGTSLEGVFQVEIVISVNGVEPESKKIHELKSVSDDVVLINEILGDTNINQGFLEALKRKPDYFWILSANEILVNNSLMHIFETIIKNPSSDIFLANARNSYLTYNVKNIFHDVPKQSALGLISGVIYKYSTTKIAFPAGPRFAWTGWGQLAVIQTACSNRGVIEITEFPDNLIYETPYTDLQGSTKNSEFEIVRKGYAHSFFGMVLLINSLFPTDQKTRKRLLFSWLKTNWFKLKYFKAGTELGVDTSLPYLNSVWMQKSATAILFRAGLAAFLLTAIGMNLKTENWKSNMIALRVKKLLT